MQELTAADVDLVVSAAIEKLRRHGYQVDATEVPGLFDVSGLGGLTLRDLIAVAADLPDES